MIKKYCLVLYYALYNDLVLINPLACLTIVIIDNNNNTMKRMNEERTTLLKWVHNKLWN